MDSKRVEVLGWLKDRLFEALDRLEPYAGPYEWGCDLYNYRIGPIAYEVLRLFREAEAADKAGVRNG